MCIEKNQVKNIKFKQEQIKNKINNIIELINKNNLKNINFDNDQNILLFYNELSYIIDNNIKPLLFNLSMRYNEGLFINELINLKNSNILTNDNNKKFQSTKDGLTAKYKLFSKISPVFVSTAHSLYNAFNVLNKNTKKIEYLFNFIDYLIFDEAGQCSPETGANKFYICQKSNYSW